MKQIFLGSYFFQWGIFLGYNNVLIGMKKDVVQQKTTSLQRRSRIYQI